METISQFLKNAIEIKNFGFNAITVSAIITIILSTYQMWGITKQIATIRRRQSTETIFMPLFIFGFFYLVTAIIYGVYMERLSIIYNGLASVFFLVLLLVAWRYKKINTIDIVSLLIFSLMIPIMIIVPNKKVAYMGCASIMLLGALSQLLLLIKNKKRGALEPKLFKVYVVTNSSWLIYGIITKDWALQLSYSISVTIMILMVVLLRRYKDS